MRFLIAATVFAATLLAQSGPFTQKPPIDLRGVIGRIDHLTADITGPRLFIAALGNESIEVVNVDTGNRLASIRPVPEPQGVLYDEAHKRLYAAFRADGSLRVFDATSYKELRKTQLPGGDADNVRLDTATGHVLAGYGNGALATFSPDGNKTADIDLGAHPESFQVGRSSRAFINLPDKQEVAVADLRTSKVVARWPVERALKNYPMALDETNHRLFVGCRAPASLLVFDTATGKMSGMTDIVGDTDDIFYDSSRGLVYVIGGLGFVDVIKAPPRAASYTRLARVKTAPGARTGLWVAAWNRLFVAAPLKSGQPARLLVFEAR